MRSRLVCIDTGDRGKEEYAQAHALLQVIEAKGSGSGPHHERKDKTATGDSISAKNKADGIATNPDAAPKSPSGNKKRFPTTAATCAASTGSGAWDLVEGDATGSKVPGGATPVRETIPTRKMD